ncbi:DUF3159 domain-containing protein [soil metagenome]
MSEPEQRPDDRGERNDSEEGTEPQLNFRETFADAMRRTGLGKVAPGEVPTGGALLGAVGGVRGLIESIVPGLGFLLIYTISRNLLASVLIPVALAVIFLIARIVAKSAPTQAFAGIVVLAVSAVFALVTGKPENNFVFGMIINSVSLLVILISLAIRWPLVGVIVGFLTNDPSGWRGDRAKRRVLVLSTWLWAGLFAVRLLVEVPLYLAEETTALGAARLITGVPLYAVLLWVTWLLVRAVFSRVEPDTTEPGATEG